MIRTFLPSLVFFLSTLLLPPALLAQDDTRYARAWNTVDSLALEGLPRAALSEVEKIYERARREKNSAMLVKAVIHRMLFQSYTEEDSFEKIVKGLQEDLHASVFPVKQVLHSLLATTYWNYYEQNRYRLFQRSTAADTAIKDFKQWGYERLLTEVITHYRHSLEHRERQRQTDISILAAALEGDTASRRLRPSLYDFLAQRAVGFYLKEESSLQPRPEENALFDNPVLFSGAAAFAAVPLSSSGAGDSLSLTVSGLRLLQELSRFHLPDRDPSALVDVTLTRLEYIHRKSLLPDRDSLYVLALERLREAHLNHPVYSEISYALADFYFRNNQMHPDVAGKLNFTPGRKDPMAYIKAMRICREALERHPESFGGKNCMALQEQLLKKELQVQTERVTLPDEPFRLLLSYRNLPEVWIRVVRLSRYEVDSVDIPAWRFDPRYLAAEKRLLSKQPVLEYHQALPGTGDYYTHAAEMKIDALPAGNYAILACEQEDFANDTAGLKFTLVQVSGLGVFRRSREQTEEIYVTDRKSGVPLPGIRMVLKKEVYEKGVRVPQLVTHTFESNREGKFNLTLQPNNRYNSLIIRGNDTLAAMENRWVNAPSANRRHPESEERTVFFTDRSIYRPGQTVHFKGFMLLSGEKTRIWPRKKTEVSFYDANAEEISSLDLISNEFGTFSGSFTIPEGGLPGEMRIENEYGATRIEVAEYKRPTFEVNFEPVSDIFRLNDSVTLHGTAKSFSGYAIDRAQVKYTVTRSGNPSTRWRRYIYPPEEPLQVRSGVIETDAEGNFSISFLAEARDSSRAYSYQVVADVTDLNGETRSGNVSLNVGNKNLLVSADIGEEIFTGNPLSYLIGARNLNGEVQESEISLKVYALDAPDHPLRERLWNAPDQFIMNREVFKESFPFDVYADEDDYRSWKPGKVCLQLDFQADSIETVDLSGLKRCESGRYLMEIRVRAASGETASEQYFFHLQQGAPGRPQTASDFIKVLKHSGAPGEFAEFLVGTGHQGSNVLYEIITKDGVKETRWIRLGKKQEKITLALETAYTGGLAVQFTLVHENRIYHQLERINVTSPDSSLEIKMLSFRDKLLPGAQEQWTVKITGPGDEKVMAEMAATLYDASLDDLLPHSWPENSFAPASSFPFYTFNWNTGHFPGISRNAVLRDFKTKKANGIQYRAYEQLAMYGYEQYGRYNHAYNNYLRQIRERKQLEDQEEAREEAFRIQRQEVGEGLVVEGTIWDERGYPQPGVSVHVKGTTAAVASTPQGRYKITVPDGGILVFSLIGYLTREITAGDRKTIDVSLETNREGLDEVMVVGYGGQKRSSLTGAVIRGTVAGVPIDAAEEDAGGMVAGTLPPAKLREIIPRKNFNETAFFYPQLRTSGDGTISLEFAMPESVTRWKMLGFAHTKDLRHASFIKELVTSKEVSVSANAPRFLRAGDRFTFTAKVVNLTTGPLQGQAKLQLLDALTLQPVDSLLLQSAASLQFEVDAQASKVLSWELVVPEGLEALTYRVLASAGQHSDGEENTIPVLPGSVLVTESRSLEIEPGKTAEFSIDQFAGRASASARPYRFTLEYTSNPAWYAVQALPYLMEYPYECSEQLFSRFFANSLATTIINSSPRIKAVFRQWKRTDSNELLSSLEKNQELKSALLEETPWVLESRNEADRKKRLALLFDLNNMQQQNQTAMRKLINMQLPDGSFPWFSGMEGSRFITQHILSGIGQMAKLEALPAGTNAVERKTMVKAALQYLDKEITADYQHLIKMEPDTLRKIPDSGKDHLNAFAIYYLYMRSFFPDHRPDKAARAASDFYLGQAETFWQGRAVSFQGMIALVLHRAGRNATAQKILRSLKERAQYSEETGMYWTDNQRGYSWHEAPIETQALLIEVFGEIPGNGKEVEGLKKWLLRNKRTNNWRTTKATAAACYALLLRGTDWLEPAEKSGISMGGEALETLKPGLKGAAGTGYLKTSWEASEISSDMEQIRISNPGQVSSWGAMYWQYFEKPENVTATGEGLSVRKTVYKETSTESGPVLLPYGSNETLQPGDLVKVRLELQADRDYQYVHLKDLRAAAFEPVDVLAGYRYQDGLGFYQATRDASMNFFISRLRKGKYILEYSLRVTHAGKFSNGFASVQCMYAPEFSARSQGQEIIVR